MKLEFNVVRMDNEDVIATSVQEQGYACDAHPGVTHVYTTSGVYQNEVSISCVNTNLYVGESTTDFNDSQEWASSFVGTPEQGQWYYWDGEAFKYKLCTGDHSGYTTDTH